MPHPALKLCPFLWGDKDSAPLIPGFIVVRAPDRWTLARNLVGEEFMVQETPSAWVLVPVENFHAASKWWRDRERGRVSRLLELTEGGRFTMADVLAASDVMQRFVEDITSRWFGRLQQGLDKAARPISWKPDAALFPPRSVIPCLGWAEEIHWNPLGGASGKTYYHGEHGKAFHVEPEMFGRSLWWVDENFGTHDLYVHRDERPPSFAIIKRRGEEVTVHGIGSFSVRTFRP